MPIFQIERKENTMSTIKDIAAEAGVSVMTVYNVINGNHSKVSEKNKIIIEKLIKEKNYVPNLTAKSLSKNYTKIIGVIIPMGEGNYNFFKDPYLSELIGVIEYAIRRKGYYAMIRSINAASDTLELFRNWNMDGAIFLLPNQDKLTHQVLTSKLLHSVFLDSYSTHPDLMSVGINDYKGGYIATKYLINMGHKNIAFAGPADSFDEKENVVSRRLAGYLAALQDSNIPFREDLIFSDFPVYDMGIDVGKKISERKGEITAVFATADIMAIGIMEGARRNGLVIPNDLSIIGFDNIDASIYSYPKLTTISQNITKKAETAIELLIDKIEGNPTTQKRILLDVEIIERQSVMRLNDSEM